MPEAAPRGAFERAVEIPPPPTLGQAMALQMEYMEWRQRRGLSPNNGPELCSLLLRIEAINNHWFAHDYCAAVVSLLEPLMARVDMLSLFRSWPYRFPGNLTL